MGHRWCIGRQLANQHFTFLAETFAFYDFKSGLLQPAPHKTCCGEGGQAAPRPGKARHGGEQLLGPHIRIFRRGEAVEEPGIDLAVHAGVEVR
ncbi:hypothetical protein D3C81_1286620 [compost metagenome]